VSDVTLVTSRSVIAENDRDRACSAAPRFR